MIKLGTYKILKNTKTNDIKRIPLAEWEEAQEKLASAEWVEIESEEEVN